MSVNENKPVYRGEQKVDFNAANFYYIPLLILQNNPASGATIFFGSDARAPLTSAARSKVKIYQSGTITEFVLWTYANSTAGTGEAWALYVRLNNSTDTLVQSVSVAGAEREWKNSGLSIPVVAGSDYIEGKLINPNPWATAPTAWYGHGHVKVTL